MEIACTMCR